MAENTGRTWPYTRGRIYFKEGTESTMLYEIKHVWEAGSEGGLNDLPANTRFNIECAPGKQPHVRAIGRFRGIFADFKEAPTAILRGESGPPKVSCGIMWVQMIMIIKP